MRFNLIITSNAPATIKFSQTTSNPILNQSNNDPSIMHTQVIVLLPTHARNSSGMLENSITSILNQTFKNFKLVIIDDASNDGSKETIRKHAIADERICHIRLESNVGLPALTGGRAIANLNFDYLAWMFDDCEWEQNCLEELLKAAQSNPKAGLIYGQATLAMPGNESRTLGIPFDQEKLQTENFIPNCATLIPRTTINSIGWLDPSVILKRVCDHDYWLRISELFFVEFVPKVLAKEHGIKLPDSLGNSVTLDRDLMRSYFKIPRNKSLLLSNIDNWNPFASHDWMDSNQRDSYAEIVIEHLARTRNLENIVNTVEKIGPKITQGTASIDHPKKLIETLIWFIERKTISQSTEKIKLHEHIQKQGDYIEKQARYIDEQHSYIENQTKMLESRNTASNEIHESTKTPAQSKNFLSRLLCKIKRKTWIQ